MWNPLGRPSSPDSGPSSNQPAIQRSIDSIAADTKSIQLTILQALKAQPQAPKRTDSDEQFISDQLARLTLKKETVEIEQALLDTLDSPQLKDRYARISPAYDSTFRWIFKGDRTNTRDEDSFSEWLSRGGSIYWITGKPGAGKSTLMKFICKEKRTHQLLQKWAGDKLLDTASFYFWIAGTPFQKSLLGLLQSLLYEILNANREIISKLFPRRWRMHRLYGSINLDPWTEKEFLDAIKILKCESSRSSRICFFIDGLDEYEGDHKEMTVFLQELSSLPDLKICVSSRPWLAFQDAFGNCPMLRVQDFTKQDIKRYATGMLQSSPRWKQVCSKEPEKALGLIQDIRIKSCGVFLWVYLVVRSLLQGLRDGDRITDLQSRLGAFPSDLEDFFMHTLERLEPSYLQQAQKFFRIAIESSEPLLLMAYSFLGEEDLDPKFGINAPDEPICSEEIPTRLEDTERRLRSRCKDLLEVYIEKAAGPAFSKSTAIVTKSTARLLPDSLNIELYMRVGFLHRTVRDFLETPGAQVKLIAAEKDGFNGTFWLIQAITAQMKALSPRARAGTTLDAFMRVVRPAFDSLDKLGHYDLPYVELLDEFDRTLSLYCQKAKITGDGSSLKHWTNAFLGEGKGMLELANVNNLTAYVQSKLQHDSQRTRLQALDLLKYAPNTNSKYKQPHMKMERLLFEVSGEINTEQSNDLQISDTDPSGTSDPPNEKCAPKPSHKHGLNSSDTKRDIDCTKRRRLSKFVNTEDEGVS